MSPLISKLPFLNIITEVLLIHVPRVKFTVENENTALLMLLVIFFIYVAIYTKISKRLTRKLVLS